MKNIILILVFCYAQLQVHSQSIKTKLIPIFNQASNSSNSLKLIGEDDQYRYFLESHYFPKTADSPRKFILYLIEQNKSTSEFISTPIENSSYQFLRPLTRGDNSAGSFIMKKSADGDRVNFYFTDDVSAASLRKMVYNRARKSVTIFSDNVVNTGSALYYKINDEDIVEILVCTQYFDDMRYQRLDKELKIIGEENKYHTLKQAFALNYSVRLFSKTFLVERDMVLGACYVNFKEFNRKIKDFPNPYDRDYLGVYFIVNPLENKIEFFELDKGNIFHINPSVFYENEKYFIAGAYSDRSLDPEGETCHGIFISEFDLKERKVSNTTYHKFDPAKINEVYPDKVKKYPNGISNFPFLYSFKFTDNGRLVAYLINGKHSFSKQTFHYESSDNLIIGFNENDIHKLTIRTKNHGLGLVVPNDALSLNNLYMIETAENIYIACNRLGTGPIIFKGNSIVNDTYNGLSIIVIDKHSLNARVEYINVDFGKLNAAKLWNSEFSIYQNSFYFPVVGGVFQATLD